MRERERGELSFQIRLAQQGRVGWDGVGGWGGGADNAVDVAGVDIES